MTVRFVLAAAVLLSAAAAMLPPELSSALHLSTRPSTGGKVPEYPPRFSYNVHFEYSAISSDWTMAFDSWRGRSALHNKEDYYVCNSEFRWEAVKSGSTCYHAMDLPIKYPTVPDAAEFIREIDCVLASGAKVTCEMWQLYEPAKKEDTVWLWYDQFPVKIITWTQDNPEPYTTATFSAYSTAPDDYLYELDDVCAKPASNYELDMTHSYSVATSYRMEHDDDWIELSFGAHSSSVSRNSFLSDLLVHDKESNNTFRDFTLNDGPSGTTYSYWEPFDECIQRPFDGELSAPFNWHPAHTFLRVEACPNDKYYLCTVYEAQLDATTKETVWWNEYYTQPDQREQLTGATHNLSRQWRYLDWTFAEPPSSDWELLPACLEE